MTSLSVGPIFEWSSSTVYQGWSVCPTDIMVFTSKIRLQKALQLHLYLFLSLSSLTLEKLAAMSLSSPMVRAKWKRTEISCQESLEWAQKWILPTAKTSDGAVLTDSLTTINHTPKPLSDSWPSETMGDNICSLFSIVESSVTQQEVTHTLGHTKSCKVWKRKKSLKAGSSWSQKQALKKGWVCERWGSGKRLRTWVNQTEG